MVWRGEASTDILSKRTTGFNRGGTALTRTSLPSPGRILSVLCHTHLAMERDVDRARTIIEKWARALAERAGKSFEIFWLEMNYPALVPSMRAAIWDEGCCPNCGRKFINEEDIKIAFMEPPRSETDLERLHAKNVWLICDWCERRKGETPWQEWIEAEWP